MGLPIWSLTPVLGPEALRTLSTYSISLPEDKLRSSNSPQPFTGSWSVSCMQNITNASRGKKLLAKPADNPVHHSAWLPSGTNVLTLQMARLSISTIRASSVLGNGRETLHGNCFCFGGQPGGFRARLENRGPVGWNCLLSSA